MTEVKCWGFGSKVDGVVNICPFLAAKWAAIYYPAHPAWHIVQHMPSDMQRTHGEALLR